MKKIITIKQLILFLLLTVLAASDSMAQRSEVYSLNLSRIRSGFNYETKTSGFDFDRVQMRYQFVNCGGDVQMGINYDQKANYLSYWHNGKSYYKQSVGNDLWPESDKFELQEIKADLYYGNRKLGTVNLNYIVGNFAGCFGETWNVLKDVGENPSAKKFKDNINKLSLRNVKVIRGGPPNSKEYKIKDKIKNL